MEFLMSRNLFAIRIWLILSVIVVSLANTPAFAQGGPVVRVDPAATSAKVNDTVNVSIKIDNIANLTAMELHLSFTPSVLEVVSVTNGGFVAADFTAQNVFDNTAGTIDYAVAQMNRAAAQGSGTFLTIAFRAKANGSSVVNLRATQAAPTGLLLSDANGLAIQASWVSGTVNVGSVGATTTSTPAAQVTSTATKTAQAATATSTPVAQVTSTATKAAQATSTSTPVVQASATSTPVTPTPTPVVNVSRIHIVRFGESLYCIGRAYKVSPWAIADANGVWWPYIIFPYQSLTIPDVLWSPIPVGAVCQAQFTTPVPTAIPTAILVTATPTVVGPTAVGPTSTPVPTATLVPGSTCRAYYTVQAGDNLFRIALRYGTTYAEIARVNQLQDARYIYVGQRLCIP
jgi:LysM repeat protein